MTTTSIPPSPARFFAVLLIGAGLVAIGIALFVYLNDAANASATAFDEFSTIPVQANFPAPDLSLTDLSGKPVSLKDHLGSVVLVNLWATWCPPCKKEMPTLQAFYEKYKENGFILIAIDQEETREVVAPFVKEFGLTFPVWLDEKYLAEQKFKTANLPSSYVIDRKGIARLMWIGGISEKNLEKYVPDIIMQ